MIRKNDKIDLIENIQLTGFREEMIQDFIQVLHHIQGRRRIRGSGMTYRIRFFHIPHNQMRTHIFRQLQPRYHGISTI